MAESIKNNQFNNSEISRKYEKMAKHIKQLNKSKIAIIANKKMSNCVSFYKFFRCIAWHK